MSKSEKVIVQVDINQSANLINAMEELVKAYLSFIPDQDEELEAIKYLRQKMGESKELYGSVLVSTQNEVVELCAKYVSIACDTDKILEEIDKLIKNQEKKKNKKAN